MPHPRCGADVSRAGRPVTRLSVVLAALLATTTPLVAFAAPPSPPDGTEQLPGVRYANGSPATRETVVIKGQHLRLLTTKSIERMAVGDSDIAAADLLTNQEVLVFGRQPGMTSLIFWFKDGTSEAMRLAIRRDLAVLEAALLEIYPTISVEGAPDRDALILRGVVPDISYSRAAEAAARSYLSSGRRLSPAPVIQAPGGQAPSGGKRPPGVSEPGGAAAPGATADEPPFRGGAVVGGSEVAVINLIRLEKLPAAREERILEAIRPLGGQVTVRRISKGPVPNDDVDVFLLEGRVPNQVTLTRVLNVAARAVVDAVRDETLITESPLGRQSTFTRQTNAIDISVIGDEAGGVHGSALSPQGGGRGRGSAIATEGGSGAAGLSGIGTGRRLTNLVSRNIARARALTVADGRILSFIETTDIPQVRVAIRLYEVKRSKLLDYQPRLTTFISNFGSPTLPANPNANVGSSTGSGGGTEILQVFNFLAGAFTSNTQLVAGKFALDLLLSVLETEGIARTLSAPALAVLSGETAEFLVGGEVPISESFYSPAVSGPSSTTGVFTTTTFKTFGVGLGIRPLVNEDDTITLDVLPEVVTPDFALTSLVRTTTGTDQTTIAFEVRTLRTTTQLQDGQALLIGGLLSQALNRRDGSTPIVDQIPLVRYLFRSFTDSKEETDLVIVVSPDIVRPPVPDAALWAFPGPPDLSAALNPSRSGTSPRPEPGGPPRP